MKLKGRPASIGHIKGRARVILDAAEAESTLEKGDILVTKMTDPNWTHLFPNLGGIITERGGILSHPAIIAREYGIPAVVSCKDATTEIPDGATISLDGQTGTITIE